MANPFLPRSRNTRQSGTATSGMQACQAMSGVSLRIILVLLCLLPAVSFAQFTARHADVIFENLDRSQGLPSPVVQAMAQDGHGFLWIGTGSGLSRWDGYHFRNYTFSVGVPGTLPDNDIYSMYTDPDGTLWAGTRSRGLARYESSLDRFQTFLPPGKDRDNNAPAVYAMMATSQNHLLVGTRIGLDQLDTATGKFVVLPLQGAVGQIAVLTLVKAPSGRIWAGTNQGLFRSNTNGTDFRLQKLFGSKQPGIWRLLLDHAGSLWIGTTSGAYLLRQFATQAVAIHESGPGPSLLDKEPIDAICEAAPGVIWLGTFGQGIVAVNATTLRTHRITHDPAFPTSLPNNTVVTLLTDQTGSVWAGTANGVGRANPNSGILTFFGATDTSSHAGRIPDSDVTAISPENDGRFWLGLNENGIELVALRGNRLQPIRHIAAGLNAPLPPGQINALTTSKSSLFIGTSNWVYRAGLDGNRVTPLPQPKDTGIRVDALLYENGTLWIGSHHGLWREDFSTPSATIHPPSPVAVPITNLEITVLAKEAGNDLWVGTAHELFRYDTASHEALRIPVDPSNPNALPAPVTSLLLDREHRLWATTWGGGVCVLSDTGPDHYKIRRLLHGLPNANGDDILQAPDGKLWVSTDDGFAIIDPHTYSIHALRQADGIAIPAYWVKSGVSTSDGRLAYGGDGGLTVIDPAQVRISQPLSPVVVTDVLVGTKPYPPDIFNAASGSPLLNIPQDANRIAIEFSSLDYSGADRNLYEYKLDGFDQNWVKTTARRRVASYTNLPPGDYVLELRGSNHNGAWGKTRSIRIHVMPAWYQTVWMKLGMLLLLLLLLTAGYRISTAYMRARQRELERRVELRTAELQKITEELQESRRQLEQIAHTDPLTGLPNRRMFSEHFRRLLATSRRQQNRSFTLILFDLDKFKDINDTYGHDAGDEWLKIVAERIRSMVRQSDCFARVGGDEFALLVADPINGHGIRTLCEALAACVREPFFVNATAVKTTFSIGLASYPKDGEDEIALFKAADIALYRAKRAGGNCWHCYSPAEVENPQR
ncbi:MULTISPECIES: ligand-binding sensor domain-containing diguanylate cyclase [Acidobacterium]|nr:MULTISPECIES: ligand-binding sensor domain-containing diguanylate cyclase [Acidobacterium]HCT60131.1 GGDEF domain-containing protein [Acidobacterium sp.]